MIRGFPTLFTHTTSIYHYGVTLADIIQSENFHKGALVLQHASFPSEESQPQRSLSPSNALLRKRESMLERTL